MGRYRGGKRARSGSFQQSEGDAEDPLVRLRAFRARMFDLKPEVPARAVSSSAAFSDGIPAVQWKPGKKSKLRKKQRLVDAAAVEDAAVPTVKFTAVKSKSKTKLKTEKETVKEDMMDRPNVVRIPGQLKPRAAVVNKEAPKKIKHKKKKKLQAATNGAQVKAETNGETGKASVAMPASNYPATKPFEEGEDPLAEVMRRVQEKMEAESARSAKKTAFAASMATNKTKKKKEKKRKLESEGETPLVKAETTASGDSAAVDCVDGREPEVEAVRAAPVPPEAKKRKGVQPPVKKEDVSEVPMSPFPSTNSGVCASTASPQKTSAKARKNERKKLRMKLLKQKKQQQQQSQQPGQQPGEQQKQQQKQKQQHDKLEQQNGPAAPSKTTEAALNGDTGAHSAKQEEMPATSIVAAASSEQPRAEPKAGKKLNPSQPKQQHAKTPQPAVTKPALKSVEKPLKPLKPVSTPATPVLAQRPQSLPASKPKKAVVSDSSGSDDSDSDGDAGRVKRRSLPALEASELSELSEEEAADEPEASSSSSEDEDAASPGPQHQRQLFSALIDEAARDTWELAEVGRLVRLFSSLGWKRRTHETAKFLRHYCPELVSAEFLDGLDVKLSSKQLLGIFERGSGKPQVFLNKLASAIENNYLHAKDPAVAAVLTRKVSELPDPSTRGICEFLLPLLESLSTVRDVGVILRRMCRHWQPERAASLVQLVLLTSVFDDLEGDQDEILEFMPQLKGLLDFPSRMDHEDADEDGNLVGLIASEDEGDGDKHSGGEDDEEEDPEAALGEILSDDEDDEEDDEEEYEGETDSEEEREAAIRYGPDQRRRRRSQFILDEADESEEEEEDEEEGDDDDEHGWEDLVGSEADE